MDKRYQIFVSSTFPDLKEERKAIIEALLNGKYIPARMEMFSASNDEQFKYIKKIIDACDYYVLIVGARYGTVNPSTGKSFTEQEYDYAVSKNIPVLAFLHNDPYNLPADKRDDDKRELLEEFKKKVSENRLCKMWGTRDGLITSVILSLSEETSENPQLGWTRGNNYDSADLLGQINVLRLEKEKLQNEITKLKEKFKANSFKIENLASGSETFIIRGKRVEYDFHVPKYFYEEIELSWDEIFSAVAPHLYNYNAYSLFYSNLKEGVNSCYDRDFDSLNDDDVQTIKLQFNALGLLDVTTSKSIKGGVLEFIGLTQKGKEYLLLIKTIKKNK